MKGLKGLVGLVGVAAALLPCVASAAEVDGLAARVGSEAILRSDVIAEMRRLNLGPEEYARVRDEMVDHKLILKAAGESKMTMQEWVVESRVREIIERGFGGDRNKLMDTLAKQKISYPEWYARMKEDMIVQAMRWNVVDKNVVASPSAMRKVFAEHADRYRTQPTVTVSVILLKPADKAKREEVSAALAKESFADVARMYSADSHAAEGGVWKDVTPAEVFKKDIADEIDKMPKGTLSHWIEIDGWSFLLRKDAETPGRTLTFAEAYDAVEADVREEAAKKAYDEWLERLRAEAYIKLY